MNSSINKTGKIPTFHVELHVIFINQIIFLFPVVERSNLKFERLAFNIFHVCLMYPTKYHANVSSLHFAN